VKLEPLVGMEDGSTAWKTAGLFKNETGLSYDQAIPILWLYN
jgi:hypothetical protein